MKFIYKSKNIVVVDNFLTFEELKNVRKWFNSEFTHIICVEPSDVNRIELKSRLDEANRERVNQRLSTIQYEIIATTGQDFLNIIKVL